MADDADADDGPFGRKIESDAKLTLDELNSLVVRELKKEGSIRLAGLDVFRKRKLKARVGVILPPASRSRFRRVRGCASPPPSCQHIWAERNHDDSQHTWE